MNTPKRERARKKRTNHKYYSKLKVVNNRRNKKNWTEQEKKNRIDRYALSRRFYMHFWPIAFLFVVMWLCYRTYYLSCSTVRWCSSLTNCRFDDASNKRDLWAKNHPKTSFKRSTNDKERTHQNEQLSNLQHFVLFVNCTDATKNTTHTPKGDAMKTY